MITLARVGRYTPEGAVEFVGGWNSLGEADWVGKTAKIGGHNVATAVFETEQPARIDELEDDGTPLTAIALGTHARSSAGAPIKIKGQLWGLVIVASVQPERLPVGIDDEVGDFTELLATAIGNPEARDELAASRARIVASADDERRRIVRDLHDGAQQRLVHTIITLKLGPARARDW